MPLNYNTHTRTALTMIKDRMIRRGAFFKPFIFNRSLYEICLLLFTLVNENINKHPNVSFN